jgi:dTMP kinase
MFQSKVLDEYDKIVPEYGLEVIDASASITDQQRIYRRLVSERLEERPS